MQKKNALRMLEMQRQHIVKIVNEHELELEQRLSENIKYALLSFPEHKRKELSQRLCKPIRKIMLSEFSDLRKKIMKELNHSASENAE